ncbi:ash family protein [Actinobacillus lignieresii]|uniref:ash family protein n=1 Tax=Actinobacillus lignieresii TaxID=720 RepID=UPI001F53F4C5|nr:ash family protein [Actinobacillus lignieresii]
MNLNQEYYKQCEIFSQEKGFTSGQIFNKFHNVVAKSTAERGNSNLLPTANITSTPKNRAFFVCGLNTPKENSQSKNGFAKFLSMVAFSGQRLIVAAFRWLQFSTPLNAIAKPWKVKR